MSLPLADAMRYGWMTSMGDADEVREVVALAERSGLDSLWVGDHIAFTVPILDPLLQLAQAAVLSERLLLGTSVYLLPLRHPVPVAKQVATLDLLSGGRLLFGVGVGGEFPNEYAACGIPRGERGARLTESIQVLRALWSDGEVSHTGNFFPFERVRMQPAPHQPGGPPIWCGGRSRAALERAGRLADGWVSYVVTPEMYRESLQTIAAAAEAAGRDLSRFDTAHLLFFRIDESFEAAWDVATEQLSQRYASDFRAPARKYCALGRPADIAARIDDFRAAGVRHLILDAVSPAAERHAQVQWFAAEVLPLLG